MIKLSNRTKYLIVTFLFGISCYGFLIKLPVSLRNFDTELHAIYFFIAAAFLNILFRVNKLDTHFLIFGMLFLFSALIEFTQEYSNELLNKKIHGKFDPVDLKYNLIGLTVFTMFWLMYYLIFNIYKKLRTSS